MSTDKKTSDHNYYLAHREDIKHRTRLYALSLKGKEVQRLAQAKYRKTTSSLEAKNQQSHIFVEIQVDKFRETKVQPWVSVGE